MADDKDRIKNLRELGRLRQEELNLIKKAESSIKGRLKLAKEIRLINQDIANTKKEEAKYLKSINELEEDGTDEAKNQLVLARDGLAAAVAYREEQEKTLKKSKEILKTSSSLIAILKSSGGLVKKMGWDNLKKWGVFEIDKELRNAAKTIGISGDKFTSFSKNLSNAGQSIRMMGIGTADLAKMQGQYSDAIGRATLFTEKGAIAMGEIAAGTGEGQQFAVEMVSAMDNFGQGAEYSRDLIENTMNIAAEMGVSGGKAAKTLQKTLQMSQRYVFKGGVKSLAKMANSAVKLKLDMDGIAGVADKVFRPEGAIELAAQLKTMGGGFAKIADPMQLMFKARNDFEGFAKDIGKASAEFVEFNSESKTFEIKGGLAADRMREIANMTGISVDKLREMAVAQKRIKRIGSVVPISYTEKDKEFIETIGQMDTAGKMFVELEGEKKYIKDLKKEDLKKLRNEKKTLKERAEHGQTFEDTINDSIAMLKELLLPVAQGLKLALGDPLQKLINTATKEEWAKRIKEFTWKIVDFGKYVGKTISGMIDTFGGGGTLLVGLGTILGGGLLFSAVKWGIAGTIFGLSAKMAMGGGGMPFGGGGKGGGKMPSSSAFSNAKNSKVTGGGKFANGIKGIAKLGGAITALTVGISEFSKNSEAGMGEGENLARSVTKGGGAGLGAWGGATLGASMGAFGGPLGMLLGGLVGGAAGALGGAWAGEGLANLVGGDPNLNDGIVKFNPKDKFLTIGDDTLVAGTNAGGNKAMAKAMTSGSDKMTVTHEHKPIKMIFEFIGLSESTANELINNDRFVKSLNLKIKEATANVFSGGKPSPNPTN